MKAHLCKKAEVKLALCAANDEQYPLPLLLYEQPPSKKKENTWCKKENTQNEKKKRKKEAKKRKYPMEIRKKP